MADDNAPVRSPVVAKRSYTGPAVALAVLSGSTVAVLAEPTNTSVYTKLDLDTCRHKPSTVEEVEGEWFCPGFGGIAVYALGEHAHIYLSYGRNAAKTLAARQTLRSFNSEGKTIEWRLAGAPRARAPRARASRARPFATIVRWGTAVYQPDESTYHGQVLVVTRLPPGGVCHVGYVDARANPDAEALAQKIADEHARAFKCGKDEPIRLGNAGPGFSGLDPATGD
jgi:hypothetical protein